MESFKEKKARVSSEWRANNKERAAATSKAWREANRERYNATRRVWARKNNPKNAARQAKRHAAKLKRTPTWDLHELTDLIYLECPEGKTVDHVVPLQGVNVSGLHVYNNLQYLTPSQNSSKGNRYEG